MNVLALCHHKHVERSHVEACAAARFLFFAPPPCAATARPCASASASSSLGGAAPAAAAAAAAAALGVAAPRACRFVALCPLGEEGGRSASSESATAPAMTSAGSRPSSSSQPAPDGPAAPPAPKPSRQRELSRRPPSRTPPSALARGDACSGGNMLYRARASAAYEWPSASHESLMADNSACRMEKRAASSAVPKTPRWTSLPPSHTCSLYFLLARRLTSL